MSYSPLLGSAFNRTKLRDPAHGCSFSGMCSMCTADCVGTCEIGISAVRGADAVYPTTTGDNQVASEKAYPIDYSHFNINGRVFGAVGVEADSDKATIYDVNLETEIGLGYSYTRYDRYRCSGCGKKVETDKPHHYMGPTKAAINLVYLF